MITHRLKHNFTAGELSESLFARVDNERYRNGCKTLLNMYAKTQGPATRRSGQQFIYDLSALSPDTTVNPRQVPFVFSKTQAYTLVFFKHTSGTVRVVFGTGTGLVEDPASPGDPYVFEFSGTFDLQEFDYAQSSDVVFINQPDRVQIAFKRLAHDEWEANEVAFINSPLDDFLTNNTAITVTPSGTSGTITLTASADLFDSSWVGMLVELNSGEVDVTVYTDAQTLTATVTSSLSGTGADPDWKTPEWGPYNGYPTRVSFFEQRMMQGSTRTRPQTVWGSKSGSDSFDDLGVSSPIVDSDAVTFTLDSGSQNKFQWMLSARQLLIGTLGDEWALSGGNYEPLSFASIRAVRHTNHGGEDLKPLMIGPVVLFLQRLGRTVNQFVYDFNTDSYITVDLSILSPHLTENYTLIDWTYQQTPNGIIWAVREDGVLLGLTFKREHKVTGWHRHTTDGKYLSVNSIPGIEQEDEVWFVVNRTIEGSSKWLLEKMATEFKSDDIKDARFLDSFLVYSGVATDTISGLDHLEGKTVDVLGDGLVLPAVVVSGGDVTLAQDVEDAVIGLPYTSELRPLPLEVEMRDGTTLGRRQRIVKLDLMLHKTIGLYYGREDELDGEKMEELPFRRAFDPTGVQVPLFTGIKHINFQEGYDRRSSIILRQTKPLPLTVVGIVDHIEVNE